MYLDRFPDRASGRQPSTELTRDPLPVPGKRTLTEGLMAQRGEALPAVAMPAALALPVRSGPRPSLQMLFGGLAAALAGPGQGPDPIHAAAARGTATPTTRLPYADQIQRAFGPHDVSGIRAHVGADAAASAREIGARAYATGDHVVLGDGADLHTIAHEAAHVVQQRQGVHLSGGIGAVGDVYEQQADAVADAVVAGRDTAPLLGLATRAAAAAAAPVQRKIAFEVVEKAFSLEEMKQFAAWTAEWLELVMEVTREKDKIDDKLVREAEEIILEGVASPDHLRALLANHKKRALQHAQAQDSKEPTDEKAKPGAQAEGGAKQPALDKHTLNAWILQSPAGPYVKDRAGVEDLAVLGPKPFNQRMVAESYENDLKPDEDSPGEDCTWRLLIINAAIAGGEEGFAERGRRGRIVVRSGSPPQIALHEAVHAFGNPAFRATLGDLLDEGTTELIAQWIAVAVKLAPGSGYPRAVATTEQLRTLVGLSQDDLMKAYFVDPTILVKATRRYVGEDYLQRMKGASPKDFEFDDGTLKAAATGPLDRAAAEEREARLRVIGMIGILGVAILTKLFGIW